MTKREMLRRWYAPEVGDIVIWKPAGQRAIDGRRYEVLAVDGDRLRLRDLLFRQSDPAGCESWEPRSTETGAYFALETAEERVAEELMR